MVTRRSFLKGLAAAAGIRQAVGAINLSAHAAPAIAVPEQIKAFCIDLIGRARALRRRGIGPRHRLKSTCAGTRSWAPT